MHEFHFQYGNRPIMRLRRGRIYRWSRIAAVSSLQNPHLSQSPRNDSKLLRFYELTDAWRVFSCQAAGGPKLTAIPLQRGTVHPIEAACPDYSLLSNGILVPRSAFRLCVFGPNGRPESSGSPGLNKKNDDGHEIAFLEKAS
jgi:hypothetical protein